MNAPETELLFRQAGAQGSGGFPVTWDHFGDPGSEAQLLLQSCAWMDAQGYGALSLQGVEVLKLLQGQVTNDVADWRVDDGGYAAYLDRKGRMVADLVLARTSADTVRALVHPDLTQELLRRLAPVAMLGDCELRDLTNEEGRILIAGGKSADRLNALTANSKFSAMAPYDSLSFELAGFPLTAQYLPDLGVPAFLLECPRAHWLEFLNWLMQDSGLSPAGFLAQEALRIETGTARWSVDMNTTNLAPECNMAHAISYDKGCYVGQETVARLRTYGQVAKRFCGFKSQELLAVGTQLVDSDGKNAALITSSVLSPRLQVPIALGFAKRGRNEAGQGLLDPLGQEVEVCDLPFLPRTHEPKIPS